jgi:GNAT superfamily N-acetyltransferase
VITERDPRHADVLRLLDELAETYRQKYGVADLSDAPPDTWVSALLAVQDGEPVGMLGLRPLSPTTVHLIRLYVRPSARSRGWAGRLGKRALEVARLAGFKEAIWDTGSDSPAVLRISQQVGGQGRDAFGAFKADPHVKCFGLDLPGSVAVNPSATAAPGSRSASAAKFRP